MKPRFYYLDIVRVLACIMVVIIHSPMPLDTQEGGSYLAILSYFTSPCIGLFFMVSGALLLSSPVDNPIDFLRKRMKRVLCPTLFWTGVYVLLQLGKQEIELSQLPRILLNALFAPQGHAVLWFMYVLIGLYLVTPILSKFVQTATKGSLWFYLSLWFVSLLLPVLRLWLTIPEQETNLLYYFSGYIGYFFLGYVLHAHTSIPPFRLLWRSKRVIGLLVLLSLIAFVPPTCCFLFHIEIDFYTFFWNLSPGSVAMAIVWWIIIRSFAQKTSSGGAATWWAHFSNLSFGIYLVHIAVMREWIWKWSIWTEVPSPVQIISCSLLTLLVSYLLIKLVSKTRFSPYIIGC